MSSNNKIVPDEYQDYIYRFTYWSLSKLAFYIPERVTPNQITVAAFIAAMIGSVLLVVMQTPAAFLYWIGFNFLWYVLDAFDGMHARRTQQFSEFGGFLDHALDNIYFIFMLTAFAVKFDLMHPLYIYILLLRVTASVIVFLVQAHVGRMHLGKFSAGLETPLLTIAMLLSFFYPHFNPLLHTDNVLLIRIIQLLDLQNGLFMKLTLFAYFFGVPVNMIQQFRFVRRETRKM